MEEGREGGREGGRGGGREGYPKGMLVLIGQGEGDSNAPILWQREGWKEQTKGVKRDREGGTGKCCSRRFPPGCG
jgi:hypothetical protein